MTEFSSASYVAKCEGFGNNPEPVARTRTVVRVISVTTTW